MKQEILVYRLTPKLWWSFFQLKIKVDPVLRLKMLQNVVKPSLADWPLFSSKCCHRLSFHDALIPSWVLRQGLGKANSPPNSLAFNFAKAANAADQRTTSWVARRICRNDLLDHGVLEGHHQLKKKLFVIQLDSTDMSRWRSGYKDLLHSWNHIVGQLIMLCDLRVSLPVPPIGRWATLGVRGCDLAKTGVMDHEFVISHQNIVEKVAFHNLEVEKRCEKCPEILHQQSIGPFRPTSSCCTSGNDLPEFTLVNSRAKLND